MTKAKTCPDCGKLEDYTLGRSDDKLCWCPAPGQERDRAEPWEVPYSGIEHAERAIAACCKAPAPTTARDAFEDYLRSTVVDKLRSKMVDVLTRAEREIEELRAKNTTLQVRATNLAVELDDTRRRKDGFRDELTNAHELLDRTNRQLAIAIKSLQAHAISGMDSDDVRALLEELDG